MRSRLDYCSGMGIVNPKIAETIEKQGMGAEGGEWMGGVGGRAADCFS